MNRSACFRYRGRFGGRGVTPRRMATTAAVSASRRCVVVSTCVVSHGRSSPCFLRLVRLRSRQSGCNVSVTRVGRRRALKILAGSPFACVDFTCCWRGLEWLAGDGKTGNRISAASRETRAVLVSWHAKVLSDSAAVGHLLDRRLCHQPRVGRERPAPSAKEPLQTVRMRPSPPIAFLLTRVATAFCPGTISGVSLPLQANPSIQPRPPGQGLPRM